ncbi:hypothetical protein EJB05_05519, partial [Eragrostis curvula]
MASSCFLLPLLVLATSTAAVATMESQMARAPAPGPSSSAAVSFLHASCAAVEPADTCYNLLLPYADSFHGSLARVARTSAGLAAGQQHALSDELARLKLRGTGAGRVPDMILADCFNLVQSSDMFANETLGRLDNLVAGMKSKKDFESQKFLAQDWLSASGSGLVDCLDWFHGAGDTAASSPVVKEVMAGCTSVFPYMEVALGLTNNIQF